MPDGKNIPCPHCSGSGVDPFDDGGTLAAKPACMMCLGKGRVYIEDTTAEPEPVASQAEPAPAPASSPQQEADSQTARG